MTAALLGAVVGSVVGAAPASAGWQARASSGVELASASLGARFDARTGTTAAQQGNPYAVGGLVTGGTTLVDVVSTSTVPARTTVTVTSGGVVGLLTTVQSCAAPWAGSTCSSLAQDVATLKVPLLAGSASGSWTVDLQPGERRYLRATTGAGVGAVTTYSATAEPLGTGGDRSAG